MTVRQQDSVMVKSGDALLAALFAIGVDPAALELFGDAKMDRATQLYQEAAACTPADATERLDGELARAELAD